MEILILGAGYVGLVTAACLADFGHTVTCVDKDESKISRLQQGELQIYEPGLSEIIHSGIASERLFFTTQLASGVDRAKAIFIAVGTPSRRGDGHADLSFVYEAARGIAPHLKQFAVIVTKSTVPVGASDNVERIIRSANPKADMAIVSNPEFLREGNAIEDFKFPDRVVIGLNDERAKIVMKELYHPLQLNGTSLFFTTRTTAELIKYASNAFLAMKITFINEFADLCERVGGDILELSRGIGLDRRIGAQFLNAGPGFGGSCFPKDTLALIKTAQDAGVHLRLLETTLAVNEARKRGMARKVITALGGSVRGRRIAVLGLTFKPNTDDIRDAPSIPLIQALLDFGANVTAYDPVGVEQARSVLPAEITYGSDPYDCARDADALVIVTEWDSFRILDLSRLRCSMKTALIVDLRNIYTQADVESYGFAYVGVGHPLSNIRDVANTVAKKPGANNLVGGCSLTDLNDVMCM